MAARRASAAAFLAHIGNERLLAVVHELHAMAVTCLMRVCHDNFAVFISLYAFLRSHSGGDMQWVAFNCPRCKWAAFTCPLSLCGLLFGPSVRRMSGT